MLNIKPLIPFDSKNPEYRILVCKEACFGELLQKNNVIANTRAMFKYSEWFDNFLYQVYPNHFLIGNKAWMLMSNSRETRNLIFVARCLAVAVSTDRIKDIISSQNFNDALNAIEAWTKEKMEKKTSLSKSKITASRSILQLTDPRGFALSVSHVFIERMYKFSQVGIG
jgi:excinuclease UvrABC nuclease subunit